MTFTHSGTTYTVTHQEDTTAFYSRRDPLGKNINFGGMINANGLRIGNWIMVAGTGEVHPAMVNIDNLRQLVEHPDFAYATGIPITPEILEKCGFNTKEKNGIGIELDEQYQKIVYLFNKFQLCLEIDSCRMPLHHVKYLHQLQNVYAVICGKELEINLSEKTFGASR